MNALKLLVVGFLGALGLFGGILSIILSLLLPLVGVWGLNVLFGLHIAYTIETWAAAFALIWCLTPVSK